MVISVAGSELGLPATAISDSPERMEKRPVINAARDGVHPRLYQELRQPEAFRGELIDAWRRRAAQLAATIGADVPIADVVGEDEEDVGLLLLRGCRRASTRNHKSPFDAALVDFRLGPYEWLGSLVIGLDEGIYMLLQLFDGGEGRAG
jgi:hypothetical protein